ncbi:hypothetical protein INR49_009729 [Caranx melampygus]|nr:hypothetical protein INR49_009729 [Caranx melampygus]
MTSTAARLARQQEREQGIGNNQHATKFLNQDYKSLRQQCLRSGCLFEDNCFPAEGKSLGYNELGPHSFKTRGVVWKRPTFINDGATRTDICQGSLGDCWLLAAIASLTLDQRVLARVVPPGQSFTEDYAGIFHFQFWQFGEWVDVVIDDRLPTRDGKLLFVHSAEGSEFWSALLEKAYAKVNGCYEALSGGNTIEGFEDFTGGIAEIYVLNKAPGNLFQIIRRALRLGSLLGCSIDTTGAYESEAVTALKLVKGHAYSVTGAEEVQYRGQLVQLVRIRNPWGQVEWTGPWSDGSSEWKYVSEKEKLNLNHVAEDGEFWMSYSDFMRKFSTLEICNLTPDSLKSGNTSHWNHYQFEGILHTLFFQCVPATFSSNPQFVVRLEDVDDDPLDGEDGCTFLVGLMQKNGRKRLNRELDSIGFAVYEVPNMYKGRSNIHLGPEVLLRQRPVAKSSVYINTREVCDRYKLPPGEYAIIPSTFHPHKNGSFILRVFSEKQAATRYLCDSNMQLRGSDLKTDGFSLDTGRLIVSLLDRNSHSFINLNVPQKDESNRLGLMEFHRLWNKIQKYLEIFKTHDSDNSGTMSSHEMRDAATQAGFHVNSAVLQAIVSRYADVQYAIDFDSFVGCLIKLEMLFKMFKALEKADSGKIELDMQQSEAEWTSNQCKMSGIAAKLQHNRERAHGVGTNSHAEKYLNQDYESLRRSCLERGQLFEDDCFEAEPSSLGFNELGPSSHKVRGVTWKRPTELCSNPKFIVENATRTDICQGALGDCWLLAAIASLTLNKQVLSRVVPHNQSFEDNYAGIFHFEFWQFGEWVDVVVDDRLPTRNGELLFVHSEEGSEFWSALLEKAYAKLNGCYEALSGGSTTEITSASDSEAVTYRKLVKGHAYSVTGAEQVEYRGDKEQLIRIRNPWGQVEWNGAWSDNSSEWRYVSSEDRERLTNRAEDGEFWYKYGIFHFPLSTFPKGCHFLTSCGNIHALRSATSPLMLSRAMSTRNGQRLSLKTRGGGACQPVAAETIQVRPVSPSFLPALNPALVYVLEMDLCFSFLDSFWMNPQFVIKLDDVDDDPDDGEEEGCTFIVGLMQKNRRKMRKMGQDMETIGFAIYELPEEPSKFKLSCKYLHDTVRVISQFSGKRQVHLKKNFFLYNCSAARSETFINLREVCNRFHLPPGEYLIVPSTFEPNKNGDFYVRVFSEKQADFQEIDDPVECHVEQVDIDEDDISDRFKRLFGQLAGHDVEISVFELRKILNRVVTKRDDIKTNGFSLSTCHNMVNLLDKDGSGKLGLVEFKILWTKIEKFLVCFSLNNPLHQIIVARYSEPNLTIDFDNFVCCLIRLESLFNTFKTLDKDGSGEIELGFMEWLSLSMV